MWATPTALGRVNASLGGKIMEEIKMAEESLSLLSL